MYEALISDRARGSMYKQIMAIGLFAVGLSACSITPNPLGVKPPSPRSITVSNVLNLNEGDTKKFFEDKDYRSMENPSLEAVILSTASKDKTQRAAFGSLMIKASDDACHQYLIDITRTEKSVRTGLGALGLLLSSAAGLSTPVESANILSGVSAAAQGLESELSDTILGGEDGYILAQAVKHGRTVERAKLIAMLEEVENNKTYISFISEFSNYHDNCGISYGQQIIRKALNNTESAK